MAAAQVHNPVPGNAVYSARYSSIFSSLENPASLAGISSPVAGIYSTRYYSLKELSNTVAVAALPFTNAAMGVSVGVNGFEEFRQLTAALTYARRLGSVDLGARFNFCRVAIPGYDKSLAVFADAGWLWRVNAQLTTGMHAWNVTNGRFVDASNEKIALAVAWGMGYDISANVFLGIKFSKTPGFGVNAQPELQYYAGDKLSFGIGLQSATSQYWMSAGWQLAYLRLGITASYHPQLGMSPGISLSVTRKKKKHEKMDMAVPAGDAK
jgi:hypothetical protein